MRYVLTSKNSKLTTEELRDEFLSSITPGVISRIDFIKWNTINSKREKYEDFFSFFKQLDVKDKVSFIASLSDALLSADNSAMFVNLAFELLGHTGKNYVSNTDYIDFRTFLDNEKNEAKMLYISEVLYDLGLINILKFEMEDYFTGIQIGLETHRRKNVGGNAFSNIIYNELELVVSQLISENIDVKLLKEEVIFYQDGKAAKTVDYSLSYNNKKIGIEINFYTASGSKPTEIKRSYNFVNNELQAVNCLLVWVTDGIGYLQMKKSLKEALDVHKNTYNLNMFKQYFINDIRDYLTK